MRQSPKIDYASALQAGCCKQSFEVRGPVVNSQAQKGTPTKRGHANICKSSSQYGPFNLPTRCVVDMDEKNSCTISLVISAWRQTFQISSKPDASISDVRTIVRSIVCLPDEYTHMVIRSRGRVLADGHSLAELGIVCGDTLEVGVAVAGGSCFGGGSNELLKSEIRKLQQENGALKAALESRSDAESLRHQLSLLTNENKTLKDTIVRHEAKIVSQQQEISNRTAGDVQVEAHGVDAEGRSELRLHIQARSASRQVDRLHQCFDNLATAGRLGSDGFKSAIQVLGLELVDEEDLDVLFKSIDKDRDGLVDFEQFQTGILRTSGVELWVRSLDISRIFADAVSFFLKEKKDILRSVAGLSEAQVRDVCLAASDAVVSRLNLEVAELKQNFDVLDARAKKGSGATQNKFQTFVANTGLIDDYYAGLGNRVGLPNPKIMEAMKLEHCVRAGCNLVFITDNYKIQTTAQAEWAIVVDGVQCKSEHMAHGRVIRNYADCVRQEKSHEIIREARLGESEVIATILYTGPLYQVYNAALRQTDCELYNVFRDGKNLFSTTIFALSSSVQKISRVMRLGEGLKLYRGLGGLMKLPEAFHAEDANGRRGCAEWGFMSTTGDRSVAVDYSGVRQGRPLPCVLELTVGAVDRGACILWFSQYPKEVEYLYPPLTFLQPFGDEYVVTTDAGPVRVIPVRASVSTKTLSVEEVVEQKKLLHVQTLEYSLEELRRELMDLEAQSEDKLAHDPSWLLEDFKKQTWTQFVDQILAEGSSILGRHRDLSASAYHREEMYQALVQEMLNVKRMARSKADLYLRDQGSFFMNISGRPMRYCHRDWLSKLRRELEQGTGGAIAGFGDRTQVALELSKVLGLVAESVNEQNEAGETRMWVAASEGWRAKDIELLGLAGGNFKETKDSNTLVMAAAENGHDETMLAFARLGVNVNAQNKEGKTALMLAADGGHLAAMRALSQLKADIGLTDENGTTALMLASVGGHPNAMRLAVELGADINARDADGGTALMSAVFGGHIDSVRAFVELKGDVNIRDNDGLTALCLAAPGGDVELVRVLASAGVDIHATDNDGMSALAPAALGGKVEVIHELVGMGLDVNGKNSLGETTLFCAVREGQTECVRVLVGLSADVNARNSRGQTALDIAREQGSDECADALVSLGAKPGKGGNGFGGGTSSGDED